MQYGSGSEWPQVEDNSDTVVDELKSLSAALFWPPPAFDWALPAPAMSASRGLGERS